MCLALPELLRPNEAELNDIFRLFGDLQQRADVDQDAVKPGLKEEEFWRILMEESSELCLWCHRLVKH